MQDAFLVFANIFLVGAAGMWGNAHWMDQVFKRRHALAMFWGYFCLKTCVLFFIQYQMARGDVPWAVTANNIYTSVNALLMVVAVAYTWRGAFAQVFLCAFACDMTHAAILTGSVYGVRALFMGTLPSGEWLLVPLSPGTTVAIIVFVGIHFAVTKPIVALLALAKHMVMRREALWTALTWMFVAVESVGTALAFNNRSTFVDLQGLVVVFFAVLIFACGAGEGGAFFPAKAGS